MSNSLGENKPQNLEWGQYPNSSLDKDSRPNYQHDISTVIPEILKANM